MIMNYGNKEKNIIKPGSNLIYCYLYIIFMVRGIRKLSDLLFSIDIKMKHCGEKLCDCALNDIHTISYFYILLNYI